MGEPDFSWVELIKTVDAIDTTAVNAFAGNPRRRHMPRIEITKIGWLWWVACVVDDFGHSTTLRHGFTAMHARRRCLKAEIRAAADLPVPALPEDGE